MNMFRRIRNNIGAVILITILGLVLMGATYVNVGPTTNIDGDVGVTAGHGYYIDDVLLTYSDVDAQQADAALTSISGLTYIEDSLIKLTANDTYTVRTLAEVRTDLGLVIGTNVAACGANTDITSLTGTNLIDIDTLNFADFTELTIATGAITITQSYHKIDTEADAATDDLTTISGGTAGDVIYLCAENDARTVVLKHDDTAGAGKIITSDGNDYSLDDDNKVVTFVYVSADSHWHMVGAAGGGAGETNTASNVGSQIEIYKQKTGVDLELRTLKANSNKIEVTNLGAVPDDIGNPATNEGFTAVDSKTYIDFNNPATANGIIGTVEIWANTSLVNCEVAVFYNVSDDNYSTRDNEAIGAVNAGAKRTFEVSLNVETGDYIGIYYTSGALERAQETGDPIYRVDGDNIPCTDVTFALYGNNMQLSLCGKYGDNVLDYIKLDVNEENIKLDDLGSPDDNTDQNASTTAHGLMPKLPFSGDLLSTTTVAFNADADTTLYTVPVGKRCVLSHAIVVAAGDAGATTTVSIGANGAETDFVPANTLSNLDAQYDVVILQPIPNTTPLKIKSYAAATVIQAQVASQSGAAGNIVYLFGITY